MRERPPEKTPLMIAGIATVLGSGGLYYAASLARGDFDDALTEEDVDEAARRTNQMVLASAAVLAVGAGSLSWGIIVYDGAPMPMFRFRF